ncbi:hypothetical protein TVAG_248550 [Trichomonas vaginalis G3]|uniref:Uncharacterized protein n=1 Tax=Trichomonas vaginalis (strain ATCC PRA-98 / G3) TaxID=412133 RepID=A2E791_TRIV3|nr:hypothetical protein TVAGG3_0283730 [Trichomonas vaginalis G3]EAY11488.1 hypothetical protein TVAG_248550 [Trichomonas vaginalis G3]KAI5526750.1 hypothetical protein TVAGG3_0283730 [Trichomonas vaginalis G3]|eukprot:XP_001323711.1 hypothetical protein [Trichomonas vaginalis G3]
MVEIIAQTALEKYKKIQEENKYLDQMFEAQQDIFDEIQQYDYSEEIEELDKEINDIQSHIDNSQQYLASLLAPKEDNEPEASKILKNIILQLQMQILSCIKSNADNNNLNVPIQNLILIEDSINKVIEELVAKGKLPETEEQKTARYKKLDDHGSKLMKVLNI